MAQVVGAGYSLSTETGDAATLVKLLRVAMLLPVIVLAALITRARSKADGAAGTAQRPPLLPGFAVGLRGAGGDQQHRLDAARRCSAFGNDASRWCLVAAIAGIGMKTQLKELATVGIKPVALMIGETVFLAALALAHDALADLNHPRCGLMAASPPGAAPRTGGAGSAVST